MKFGLLSSVTNKIILINVLAFIAIWIAMGVLGVEKVLTAVALQPSAILSGQSLWTIVTSMFAHVYFWHLFVNMFSLYFLGNFVENIVGKKRLVFTYLASGLFAGIFWTIMSGLFGTGIGARIVGSPNILGLGASGAVFGLVGLLALLTPKAKVYLIAGPLVALISFYIIQGLFPQLAILNMLSLLVTFYIIFSVFSMMSFNPGRRKLALPIELEFWMLPIIAIVPLIVIGLFIELPIGNMAHLGGLILGLIFGFYLKEKFPKKTKMIARHFK